MISKSPTAVLIHGLHLQTPDWQTLVWGSLGLRKAGRIPRGIEIAVKENAELIIWGTGASVDTATGNKESEYTRAFALARIAELASYVDRGEQEVRALIEESSIIQTDTQNTKDEVLQALVACREKGIHTLYLVSSPTHVPRCLLTACQLVQPEDAIVLCGVAADTAVDVWHPKDVVVVEPAHRPDRSHMPFERLAKRLVRANKNKELAPKLYKDVEELLNVFDAEVGNIKGV